VKILSAQIPFRLEDGALPSLPTSTAFPISLTTSYSASTSQDPSAVAGLEAAIKSNLVVDIDIQGDYDTLETTWSGLADLLTKATASASIDRAVILNNLLPPPHDLSLPIVKLLTHPTYQAYQANIATFSLFQNTYVKFLPPDWSSKVGASTDEGELLSPGNTNDKEWKRRIKMYRAYYSLLCFMNTHQFDTT
jgi:hypothetical protein